MNKHIVIPDTDTLMAVKSAAKEKNISIDEYVEYLQDQVVLSSGIKRTMLIQDCKNAMQVSNFIIGLYRWDLEFSNWSAIKPKLVRMMPIASFE